MSISFSRRADRPVYREVLAHAIRTAWRERRYWPLALFASLLLTAGSYDILLRAVDAISTQSLIFTHSSNVASAWVILQRSINDTDVFSMLAGIQLLLVVTILLLGILIVSCVSQAGLVFALGAVKRGDHPTLTEAIRVGGGAFWPVAALNALALTTLWILRFLAAFPLFLALERQTAGAWFIYFLAFLLFLWLSFVVTVIHIFTLNALLLQGTPIAEGILRSYTLFKKNWIVVIETASVLFVIAIALGAAAVILFFIALIPLFAIMLAAAAAHASALLAGMIGIALALAALGLLAFASFLTQLQYATWIFLYRRLGEGGVIPKLHRWIRALFGTTTVPQ